MGVIRVECDTDDLEWCYIEVSDRWTRADFAALFKPAEFGFLWLRKVQACSLALVSTDDPLTDIEQVFVQEVDEGPLVLHPDIDMRLRTFPEAALVMAADRIASLGKANARLSSGGTGRAANPTPPMTETETTQAA